MPPRLTQFIDMLIRKVSSVETDFQHPIVGGLTCYTISNRLLLEQQYNLNILS